MEHQIKTQSQNNKTQHKSIFKIIVKLLFAAVLMVSGSPAMAIAQIPKESGASAELSARIQSAGLPIGQVETFQVKDAKGTAVLIPQVHQGPGTDPADKSNDSAQKAQGQIYQIVSYLTKDAGVPLVMAEGDMYGQVSGQKISQLKTKLDAKNQLVGLTKELKSSFEKHTSNSNLESRLISGLESAIQSADREMILSGAPYKLKAEGAAFTLYGAETPATYKAAANVVRDYIYLQDRMSQLSGPGSKASPTSSKGLDSQSVLNKIRPAQSTLTSDITQLKQLAASSGNDSETNLLAEVQKTLGQLMPQQAATASQAPVRANNPYANISDVKVLNSKLKAAEANIQRTVVDQRNSDTAENFASMLVDTNQTVGILQFGAAHEKGLVQELQKQGISVIVAKPQEVLAGDKAAPSQKQPVSSPSSGTAKTSSSTLQKLVEQLKQKKLTAPKQSSPQPSPQSSKLDGQKLKSLQAKLNLLKSKKLSR